MFDNLKEAALAYASWGWPVLPCNWMEGALCSCGDPECRSPGKHPLASLVPRGLHQASTDHLVVEEWWTRHPNANVAIRTGQGVAVIDLDRKADVDGVESLNAWATRNGVVLPLTLTAHTGGGGYHCYFSYDPAIKIPSRVNVLGPGVDVRADGGYVLAPTSNHKSGRAYEWDGTYGPRDYGLAAMPPELVAALTGGRVQPSTTEAHEPAQAGGQAIQPDQVDEIVSALSAIPSDDRDTWLQVGMALESTRGGEQAYKLWDEWSKTSPKYDPRDQRRVWRSFRPDHGVTLNTLYWMAKGRGWVEPGHLSTPAEISIAYEAQENATPDEHKPPEKLLTLPGVLGEFVQWANATSPIFQPQFSVQAALALGAVALGRNWVTDRANYSPLYLMVIGESGCGKDHTKYCLTKVLALANEASLLNGSGYTSDGAVYSALMDRPNHLALIDEMGLMLEGARSRGNHVGASALRVLMEVWGHCHGVLVPKQYSTMNMTEDQKKRIGEKIIYNPCLTILGLTTPAQFYSVLSGKDVANGFLNRWLIVETAYGFGEEQDVFPCDPPESVLSWVRSMRAPVKDLPIAKLSGMPAAPHKIFFSEGSMSVFKAYGQEIRSKRIQLAEEDGMGELLSRSREMAMRIALIIALSDGAQSGGVIQACHATWAVDYVRHYSEKMLKVASHRVADTPQGNWGLVMLDGLKKVGKKGITESAMCLKRPFKDIPASTRRHLREAFLESGHVLVKESDSPGKKKAKIWLWSGKDLNC